MTRPRENQIPELIALTGLDGTGKGHLARHLRDEHGFLTLGASEIIKNVKSQRPHLKDLHPDEATRRLKEELGPTFITDSAVAQYQASRDSHTGLVLDGPRRLPEVERFRELGGKVLHVDADPQERFKKLVERGREDAPQTVEAMLARDEAQLQGDPTDKNSMNMKAIINLADDVVLNRYTADFHKDAINALKRLK